MLFANHAIEYNVFAEYYGNHRGSLHQKILAISAPDKYNKNVKLFWM
jgi:hypothetical protein